MRNVSRIPVCLSCLSAPKPFVAEYFCTGCNTPFVNAYPLDAAGLCGLCRRGLTGYDAAFSFGEYDGTLQELIHLFKYGRIRTLAKPLGRLLSSALPREIRFDGVVPMPLHWRRQWNRGFNQSELLAEAVARRASVPVWKALRRKRPTLPQAGLTNAQRRTNVSGAFEVRKGAAVEGRHILLVDDVLTTGASVNACAAALRRAGARRITVLTLARVDRRNGIQKDVA
ncbi:MAG: ComF family protein [Bryobacteraceae bacterium]